MAGRIMERALVAAQRRIPDFPAMVARGLAVARPRVASVGTALFLMFAMAAALHASPWPRAPGGVFLSLAGEADRDGNRYAGAYGEYGFTPRDTLGFRLGHGTSGETEALIWWQRALDDGTGPDRLAVSAGVGAVRRDGALMPEVELGFGWGRGIAVVPDVWLLADGGWLGVEARTGMLIAMKDEETLADLRRRGASGLDYFTPETQTKVEMTLGLRPRPSLMVINQLRLERRKDTGSSAKFALSLVQEVVAPVRVELGLIEPISGMGERAVKLGMWLEF